MGDKTSEFETDQLMREAIAIARKTVNALQKEV